MPQLPLEQAIPRFKANEERVDNFTNGSDTTNWLTSTGVAVPSLRKFLRDKSAEIQVVIDSTATEIETITTNADNAIDTAVADANATVDQFIADGQADINAAVAQADSVGQFSISDMATLQARTAAIPVNTIIHVRSEGYTFRVVSSNPDRTTAGGTMLKAVWRGDLSDLLASNINTGGGANASPLLNAYLAARAGLAVTIPPGTYRLDSTVNIPSETSLDLRNCTFNLANLASGLPAFKAAGTLDAPITMTTRPALGALTIYLNSTAGFVRGDVVKVMSDAVFDPARTNSKIGELGRVSNVAADRIVLYSPLMDNYDIGTNGRVVKMNQVRRVNITGPAKFLGYDAANTKAILFENAVDCTVSDIVFEKFDDRALWLIDCDNVNGDNLTFTDFDSPGTGYGISVTDATQHCRFTNITGRRVRHLFATNNRSTSNGIPRHITVDGFSIDCSAYSEGGSGGDAMDTHAASEHITFSNGVIRRATGCGINSEGASTIVSNVKIYDPLSHGVYASNFSAREGVCIIDNVTVERSGEMGIRVRGNGGQRWKVLKVHAYVADSVGAAFDASGTEAKMTTDLRINATNAGSGTPFYLSNCRWGVADLSCDGQSVTANSVYMFRLRDCIGITARLTGRMSNAIAASRGVLVDTATTSRDVAITVNLRNDAGGAGSGVEIQGGTNMLLATSPRIIDNFATAVVGA